MPLQKLPPDSGVQAPGDSALAIAMEQRGKPYVFGATGPDSFDCSGLTHYSYINGPNIDIGRIVTDQWNSPNATTIVDGLAIGTGSGLPNTIPMDQLENGDLIFFFAPGAPNGAQHVQMYAGGGKVVQALQTGTNVMLSDYDITGSSFEPFRGIRRVGAGGAAGAAAPTSKGTNNNNTPSDLNGPLDASYPKTPPPDPRSNLPFSAFFQGQVVSGVPTSGSLAFSQGGSVRTSAQLVRGGMVELLYKQFRCYFMMNPQEIDVDAGINTNMLSPFQLPSDIQQYAGSWVTNQTISFTIYFNRMYEVWQGNIHGPNGGPGPSDEGCRWDIRALERLMGIFDAQSGGGTEGNNGWGSYPAQMMPLQVVFGGPNSFMFQGMLNGLSTYYTIFDTNMIPVEAYAEVQIMRMYEPANSQKDLISPITTNATGAQAVAPPKTFPKTTTVYKAGKWSTK